MKACGNLLLGAALVLLFLALIVPWPYGNTKEAAKGSVCLSNLKQQALGMLLYQEDQGRFPGRERWMDALSAYVEENGYVFHCPEVAKGSYGYAFNSALSRAKMPKEAETTLLVFESTRLGRSASDDGTHIPRPGRHRGRSNVAYADGHAKRLEASR